MNTEASVSLAELNDPPAVKFETSSVLLPLAWAPMSEPSQARKVIGSVRPAPAVAWKRIRVTPSASRTRAAVVETTGNAVQVPVVLYSQVPTGLTNPSMAAVMAMPVFGPSASLIALPARSWPSSAEMVMPGLAGAGRGGVRWGPGRGRAERDHRVAGVEHRCGVGRSRGGDRDRDRDGGRAVRS